MASEVKTFTVRGSVYDKETRQAISKAEIQINGGRYTRTDANGKFNIIAKKGDELIVTHSSFKTIRYTILDNERIYIEVLPQQKRDNKQKPILVREAFNKLIDSADSYITTDAAKSIKFIGDALDAGVSDIENAEAYELLGDVHVFWKQYDLAISAYITSIENQPTSASKLKLANAYTYNKQYQKSLATFTEIKKRKLSNYQKVQYYEGLGDAKLASNDFLGAITAYNEGLAVVKTYNIKQKRSDLNSKIAQAYNLKGDKEKATSFFSNSLQLAEKESRKRVIEEQVRVAEFNNENQNFQDEIKLRKAAINNINKIELDSIIPNESALTVQKQNYKIGNAYLLNNESVNAIPYLEKSVEEADKRGDLEVKKDATRKLSEALLDIGEREESYAVLSEHINIVDELYTKKIQEISQAARFSRIISEQQNRITSIESDRALSKSKYELTQERNFRQQIIIYTLLAGIVLFLVIGYLMYKNIKQQRLANNILALKSLRSQMNPHFIFNALNSVNSFIAVNNERLANKYLSDFSKLMRSVLENSDEDFITLSKEIELLNLYIKLEHFRFKDKFDYDLIIDENIDIEAYQIPPMLLQPYIENAVWHGLRYKNIKGYLKVELKPVSANKIKITITDNGIGRTRSKALKTSRQSHKTSKGMQNIEKRIQILNEMYKDRIDISVSDLNSDEDCGTKVDVNLNSF